MRQIYGWSVGVMISLVTADCHGSRDQKAIEPMSMKEIGELRNFSAMHCGGSEEDEGSRLEVVLSYPTTGDDVEIELPTAIADLDTSGAPPVAITYLTLTLEGAHSWSVVPADDGTSEPGQRVARSDCGEAILLYVEARYSSQEATGISALVNCDGSPRASELATRVDDDDGDVVMKVQSPHISADDSVVIDEDGTRDEEVVR